MKHNFSQNESKWQKIWHDRNLFDTPPVSQEKKYILDMFPYPSGDGLHVGHVRIYTASDVLSKYYLMNKCSVLHPTGWDAFGLPAENYAIKHGVHPTVSTAKNIANIKKQMMSMGFGYNWDHEINTTDPNYYKWTQWIFLKLFESGLAYEAEVPINWCPKDKTGLANEEVINGKCERCGAEVEKRNMRQWMLKITAYADRLLKDLDLLDWPESIKLMQKNWIGQSVGAEIKFKIDHLDETIKVFTTRPDTLFGATYLVLAPEHNLVPKITQPEYKFKVQEYVDQSMKRSEIDRTSTEKTKTGVFTGAYAVNPINKERIPVWIADYVLPNYGTGAIMAVPAHDDRDFAFAKIFELEINFVIAPLNEASSNLTNQTNFSNFSCAYTDKGILINSGEFNGLSSEDGGKKIVETLKKDNLAEFQTQYKLRDWVFSRQRYWGEPIPIIHCQKCGVVPVPEKDLPVKLPDVEKYEPTGTGESPLSVISDWVNTKCPKCTGAAKRETNTMPQWAGSCWYYLRFIDPNNQDEFAKANLLKNWLPVDRYLGGAEHAVLHLLYARFWHKFLYDQQLVPNLEPFQRLESVGTVLANSYKDEEGHYVHVSDVVVDGEMAFQKSTGKVLSVEIEKMSKSKGNVVSPDDVIKTYGADALRVYIMFIGNWNEMCSFDIKGLQGSSRFLIKVIDLFGKVDSDATEDINQIVAQSIIKVTGDIEKMQFNTAISQMMILVNHLQDQSKINRKIYSILIQLLSPFAPHIAEEMWQKLGNSNSVFESAWPKVNESLAKTDKVEIVVQINGKIRGKVVAPTDSDQEKIVQLAKNNQKLSTHLDQNVIKTIFVPNKLINFVIK